MLDGYHINSTRSAAGEYVQGGTRAATGLLPHKLWTLKHD